MVEKILVFMMYVLWIATIIGLLIITFTNFQYPDMNTIVIVLFLFTLLNTFITVKNTK